MASPTMYDEEKNEKNTVGVPGSPDLGAGYTGDNADGLHRLLDNRQIQLIAIGGSIGTALFVSIGGGLAKGGPGSLFLAYTLYSGVLALVNNSMAEMSTYMPISGGFIRLAGHWVDEALGFWAGWNFFLYEAILIPFEITAFVGVLTFWSDKISDVGPTAGICAGVIALYAAINILAVRGYGEAEFWLSGGKVILIFILFSFTFVTMVGGNPQNDAYGFRYWSKPGSFNSYLPGAADQKEVAHNDMNRFHGFLGALWSAGFTVVGPEYISMVAAEAKHPSVYIKTAFKTVYYRFCFFFVVGSLAVGIVLPYNYPELYDMYFGSGGASGNAAGSPYVMAMTNMGVKVLPHIVNALMLTSIFSAGNTYMYAATRSLYGLALEGRAPAFLRKCTRQGVPIFCFCIVMVFPFLSFLACSNGSSKVLTWLIDIMTGGSLINYLIINVIFINYYWATQVQGFDRSKLPYCGWFQPYGAYLAFIIQFLMVIFYGYSSFMPTFSVQSFFQNYSMQILGPILFFSWKIIKKTRYVRPHEVDLVWERPVIDAYEAANSDHITGFWEELGALIGINKVLRKFGLYKGDL